MPRITAGPAFERARWQNEIAEEVQHVYPELVNRRWSAEKLATFWMITPMHPCFRVRLLQAMRANRHALTQIVARFGVRALRSMKIDPVAGGVYETLSEGDAPKTHEIKQLRGVLKLRDQGNPHDYAIPGALQLLEALEAGKTSDAFEHLEDAAGFASMPIFDLYRDDMLIARRYLSDKFVEVLGVQAFTVNYCEPLRKAGELG